MNGITFVNATDSPTVLVTGGALTMRNSTIRETTGGSQAALAITGGSVDLGTAAEPGGNTLVIEGVGDLIRNEASVPVAAL